MNNKVLQRVLYGAPYVRIVEQPKSKGHKFRFTCKKSMSKPIYGVNSNYFVLSYPSIEIVNYNGPAYVVISCVRRDFPYFPHPYKIVSKSENTYCGIFHCTIMRNNSPIKFPYLAIQCIKKRDMIESLEERAKIEVDPFKTGFYSNQKYDIDCLRLCFQVFIEGPEGGKLNFPLDPVVSEPIYDKKAGAELVILWLSHNSASAAGGEIMCILSERLIKNDVEVRFFNKDNRWDAIAETACHHHHKKVAIIFTCPNYFEEDIDEPVTVQVELRRPSDGEVSPPATFEYLPVECDDDPYERKTKRPKLEETPTSLISENIIPEDEILDLRISAKLKDRKIVIPEPHTVTSSQVASLLLLATEPQSSNMPPDNINFLSKVAQEIDRFCSDDHSNRLRTIPNSSISMEVEIAQAINNLNLSKYSVDPEKSDNLYLPKSNEISKSATTTNFSNNVPSNRERQQPRSSPKKQKVENPKKNVFDHGRIENKITIS